MKKLLCLILFAFGAASCGFGQSNYGAISGTVKDAQHLTVSGVTVQLTAASTLAVRRVVTGNDGHFEALALLPDEYEIKTEAPGFASSTERVRLEVGQKMELEISLNLNSRKEDVTVSAAGAILNTTDASVGEVVEPKSIRELPLNGRMLIDLVLTVPGAHVGFGAQTGATNPLYWRPGQRSAVVIGGARPNANYFLIDGGVNTDPTFNTQNLSLSPDAVREFQVQTGAYSAELGGAGGGQVNIVTNGGTSHFHGTAYEFLRNGAMDAHSFNEMEGGKFLVQNNFGASLGGPLRGKKTFFFTNYEDLRKVKADTAVATVPTGQEAAGDFSQSGVNIFNSFSSHPNPSYDSTRPVSASNPATLRDPFPNNRIPASLLNPAAQTMLGKYAP